MISSLKISKIVVLILIASRTCVAFEKELFALRKQQESLEFATPSDQPSYSPSSSPAPTKSSSPSTSHSPTSAPNPASNSTTPAPTPSSNSTTPAPNSSSNSTTPAPSIIPASPSASPITQSPTKKYTTDPTSPPVSSSSPTPAPVAPAPSRGFGYYVLQTIKWIFIIGVCAVLIYFARENWDQIYYYLMQCLHALKTCCGMCLEKSKEIVTRMIIRMNEARGVGGGSDDGSMLDGLLMGERD